MARRVLWFMITIEMIVVFGIMMGNFPAPTSILYPYYKALKEGASNFTDESNSTLKSFGIWTSRKNYAENPKNDHNQFDHRVNTCRTFHIFSIIIAMVRLMLLVNEICMNRWDTYENPPPDAAHAYYTAQYVCIVSLFYILLIDTWVYTTLVSVDWVAWPLSLLICALAMSAMGFVFLTIQMCFPPKQDHGNGRVKGLPLVFLVVAMAIGILNFLMSFACLATYTPPNDQYGKNSDIAKTTLAMLAASFDDPAYKHAVYAFFACEMIANLEFIIVISVMLMMRTEEQIRRFTYVVLASAFILTYFSLAATWMLSRAPALLHPEIVGSKYASGFYLECVKYAFSNVLLAFVIAAFIVDPQDSVKDKHRLHKKKKEEKEKTAQWAPQYASMDQVKTFDDDDGF